MSTGAAASLRARSCPQCPQCGGGGVELHRGLTDPWFDAPGTWNLRQCTAGDCGLVWLDPMPLAEDLAIAYRTYYTHAAARPDGLVRRLYRRALDGYFARTRGYAVRDPLGIGRLLGRGLAWSAARRETLDLMTMGLPPVPGGRCVDVGCGDGVRVEILRRLGWRVEGLEPDAQAVARATARGLPVFGATLEERAYAAGSMDAITMAHVIEHLPDPFATLRECARVLVPGGRLVMLTPNTRSLGARRFGARWRGLEPPRHLHLFDRRSLERAVRTAGLEIERLVSLARIAAVILEESTEPALARLRAVERPRDGRRRRAMAEFEREERDALRADPDAGEELLVVARR